MGKDASRTILALKLINMKKTLFALLILACATISMGQLQHAVAYKNSVKVKANMENKWFANDNLQKHNTWSVLSLINIFVPQLKNDQQTELKQTLNSNISAKTKSMLRAELSYHYTNRVLKFCKTLKQKISKRPLKHSNKRLSFI